MFTLLKLTFSLPFCLTWLAPMLPSNTKCSPLSETVPKSLCLSCGTVIVIAVVHRGFGRRLPYHQVTNFLDLPALGRRQPPYM
ncbi:Uncharacterized protein RDABS01_016625, partial [Bienertia sinuspersici]